MTLASMAPLSAVRCAREVTVVLDGFPVDELSVISLIPVQKLPKERIQLLPSGKRVVIWRDIDYPELTYQLRDCKVVRKVFRFRTTYQKPLLGINSLAESKLAL